MKTLYHATPKDNTISIMCEGIKAGFDGVIYFCETPDDCLTYMSLYADALQRYEYAVIPVEFSDEEFANMETNIDNSSKMPTAYAYMGNISADRVPHNLQEIPLFRLSWD